MFYFSMLLMFMVFIFGLAMNVLTYYGLQEGNEKTRIATLVFHIIVWVLIAPSVFFNKRNFIYIIRSKASFKDKSLSIAFYIFFHALFILRTVLFLGIYPCIILINKDYGEFKAKLTYA